mmetsp:Transcript_34603/g.80001  ORF Transcript_34603/g.80001 Transcript_34603/m.80001 type:complete len:242 (-) Transcript_34603:47-772(-)
MEGVWAPKPSSGPHKMRECLPLCIILRNRLKYALTNKECMQICMEKCVKVDGKVRTDHNFPAGLMDVVEIDKSNDKFRLLLDTKGRFVLSRISAEEATSKLCRVTKVFLGSKGVPSLVTHDGRTIRYPDPDAKVNDTIKVDIATGKMTELIKFRLGATVMVFKGNNAGRVGTLNHIEKHDGSFDITTIRDSKGHVFSTRLQNIFILGATKSSVVLPKGKGIRKNIMEEKADAIARGDLSMK